MQQDPEQIARQKEQLTRQLGRIVITCLEDGTTEDLVLNPERLESFLVEKMKYLAHSGR